MTTADIILRFLEAAALGALMGIEREVVSSRHMETDDFDRAQPIFGGLRSYMLISLLGALSVYLGEYFEAPLQMVAFVGGTVFMFLLVSYIYSSFRQNQVGVTSEFAALFVFFLGAMTMAGEAQIAIFLGIFITIMLTYKHRIRSLIAKIGEDEITTTLKFAVISLIILPLLPNESYSLHDIMVFLPSGPISTSAFINPYKIWFFVVVMSAVSYVGYVLSKLIGANRGIVISGAIGGIVSSTAVTSAMAEKSHHDHGDWVYPTVIATITACSIMLFRVIFIVAIFNPSLLAVLFIPLLVMIIVSAGSLWWCKKRAAIELRIEGGTVHESPFQIGPALKFAGLVLLIKFFSTVALAYQDVFAAIPLLGNIQNFPLYLVSIFSGLADVDAITQDMAERSKDGIGVLSEFSASLAIILALATNTFTKITLAKKFGHPKFGTLVLRILGLVLGAGILTLVVVGLVG